MTGKRKPTRAETRAAWIARANTMREWLTERREAAIDRRRLNQKAALLAGPSGGGSGVTVEMRRISGEAEARPPVYLFEQTEGGANREARRNTRGHKRTRGGQLVNPLPASRNLTYVAALGVERGKDA